MDREELLAGLEAEIVARKGTPDRDRRTLRSRKNHSREGTACGTSREQPRSRVSDRWTIFIIRPSARYQQGEYSARGYYEDAFDYPAVVDFLHGPAGPTILLFEGIFLFRRELNAYWDFRILVDIDAATSLSRALERDTNVIGPADGYSSQVRATLRAGLADLRRT
jgi:hypothetical protein